MSTELTEVRRPWSRRITTVVWGLLIAGVAALAIVELSGNNVDFELALIVGLVVLGGWLLMSALMSTRRPRAGGATPAADVAGGGVDAPVGDDEGTGTK